MASGGSVPLAAAHLALSHACEFIREHFRPGVLNTPQLFEFRGLVLPRYILATTPGAEAYGVVRVGRRAVREGQLENVVIVGTSRSAVLGHQGPSAEILCVRQSRLSLALVMRMAGRRT